MEHVVSPESTMVVRAWSEADSRPNFRARLLVWHENDESIVWAVAKSHSEVLEAVGRWLEERFPEH